MSPTRKNPPEVAPLGEGAAPDIFLYTDFRRFLSEAWTCRKLADPKFSHRFIAGKAGFSTSAFFGKVLAGEANLSPTAALKLAELFRLNRAETRYFEHLVLYAQARGPEERALFLDQIVSWRRTRVPKVKTDQMGLFEHWYIVAVREVLDLGSPTDPETVASMLRPRITAGQARKALDTLAKLGLAARDEQGAWRKTEPVLTTGVAEDPGIDSFRRQTMGLALEAMDRFGTTDRSISTLTVTLSPATFERLRDRFRHLRREILDMASEETDADRVVQVNIQAFPVAIARQAQS